MQPVKMPSSQKARGTSVIAVLIMPLVLAVAGQHAMRMAAEIDLARRSNTHTLVLVAAAAAGKRGTDTSPADTAVATSTGQGLRVRLEARRHSGGVVTFVFTKSRE